MSKQDQFEYRQIVEFRAGRLTRGEAARLLRKSERSVSRLASAVAREGLVGILHGNRGRTPANGLDAALKRKVMKLVATRYYDFNMLHCLEILKTRHKIVVARETFRKWCHEKQLVKQKRRRRSQPRNYRSRMPAEGYLLQMDGSPHRYNGRDVWSLIIAIDDATSEIPYGEFFPYETTAACMKVLEEIIRKKGVPRALYVDKAGWAGGGKRIEFTQFHRACDELGIQVLFANSPEAKGRVERAFRTIQDRIIPELRVSKIRSISSANRYLNSNFLPQYWNKKNTVAPEQSQTEYRHLNDISVLRETLCYKSYRRIDRAQCISLGGDIYHLTHPNRSLLAKKRVEIRHYKDAPIGIYLEQTKLQHRLVKKYRKAQETFDDYIEKLESTLPNKCRDETKSLGN